MPTYNVDDLTAGPLLDAAVARALGYTPTIEGERVWLYPSESTMPPSWQDQWPNTRTTQRVVCHQFHPSREWCDSGWLLKEHGISLNPPEMPVHRTGGPSAGMGPSGVWGATSWKLRGADGKRRAAWDDHEPLAAAMKLLVKCRVGDTVDL